MKRLVGINRMAVGFVALAFPAGIGPAAAADIVFQDQRHKTIVLSAPAQSAVVLPKPIPSLFIAIDEGPQRLKGMHPAAKAVIIDSPLGKLFPEVAHINTGVVADGFIPNVEEMLRVNPDVVFQWTLKAEDYFDPMERVGLKVVGLGWGSYQTEMDRIRIVGKVLGRDHRAEAFIDWQAQVREEIQQKLASIPHEERTRMLFFDRVRRDELTVFGRDEFFFQVPGLRNLAFEAGLNKGVVQVDAEQILVWDPDIIFLSYYDPKATPQDIYANPVFAGLSAVRNRRVYKTPRLDPASHEAPLVWMWMSMLAYPDLYAWDLRANVKRKYRSMYGKVPSDSDVTAILDLQENGASDRYRALFER